MKTNLALSLVLLAGLSLSLTAQELPLLTEKQGTFEILSRTDYVGYDCGYTKAEMTAHLQRITDLVTVVRQNPVLTDMKGFDGRARIYNLNCKEVSGYGIPARISFEFASWFSKKDGTPAGDLIEPPEWSLISIRLNPDGGLRTAMTPNAVTSQPL